MVRSSWKPSERLPRTSRRKLIFAKAGMRTSDMAKSGLHGFGSGFLCHAALRLADLFFDFRDTLGLDVGGEDTLPFSERFFPFSGGQFGAAGLGVNIAEMGVHCGIVGIAFERFAQRGFGVGELVLLEINPAQAIEIRAVVRIFIEGALNQRLSFVEANAEIAEHVTVIVENRRALGIDGERFLEFRSE